MAGGTVTRRGNNSYRLEYMSGFDTEGKRTRYRKTITANNPSEAKKELALFIAECERGEFCSHKDMTVSEFAKKWLKEYVMKKLADKTKNNYQAELNNRILPALGHIKLKDLKPMHIIQFNNSLDEAPRLDGKKGKLSSKSKLNLHRLITAMLNDAVYWQVIPYNPASRVEAPKVERKTVNCFDEDNISKMLECVECEELKWKVILYIALYTGMRRGEIMGLEWKDIDFKNSVLTVVRTSIYVNGLGIITKEPKNETSKRCIVISDSLVGLLKFYQNEQREVITDCGEHWVHTDRLFTAWNGEPMHPDSICNWFTKFLKKNKLPKISFHGLRHTNATLLINSGVNVRAISSRLGHANPTTTLNIYTHALQSVDKTAANLLENKLSDIKNKPKE